jgi:NADH:ubiquinone reductase (non-electrogenic)
VEGVGTDALLPCSQQTRQSLSLVRFRSSDALDPALTSSTDNSEIKGATSSTSIEYDYLVYAVGAEVQTFNIPGVKEHAVFMKELHDVERVRAITLVPVDHS